MSTTSDGGGVECPTCGDQFGHTQGMKTHHALAHGESIAGVVCECEYCGEEYRADPGEAEERQYCSQECADRSRRVERLEFTCENCGESFGRAPGLAQYNANRFCGPDCYGEWYSENRSGMNSHAWRGGNSDLYNHIRANIGPLSWPRARENARESGDVCHLCGERPVRRNLQMHHIIPILTGGTNGGWNLLPLCPTCHRKVERKTKEFTDPVIKELAVSFS